MDSPISASGAWSATKWMLFGVVGGAAVLVFGVGGMVGWVLLAKEFGWIVPILTVVAVWALLAWRITRRDR